VPKGAESLEIESFSCQLIISMHLNVSQQSVAQSEKSAQIDASLRCHFYEKSQFCSVFAQMSAEWMAIDP
jgi:hypothetical protein